MNSGHKGGQSSGNNGPDNSTALRNQLEQMKKQVSTLQSQKDAMSAKAKRDERNHPGDYDRKNDRGKGSKGGKGGRDFGRNDDHKRRR